MTEKREYLTDHVESRRRSVTFNDGVKNKGIERGTLNVKWMPKFKNVLHIKGMKENSISISQLYNEIWWCSLINEDMVKEDEKCIIIGSRIASNYCQSCERLSQHDCKNTLRRATVQKARICKLQVAAQTWKQRDSTRNSSIKKWVQVIVWWLSIREAK